MTPLDRMVAGLGSPKTARDYNYNMRQFCRTTGTTPEEFVAMTPAQVDDTVEAFIQAGLAAGLLKSTVRTMIAGPERFLVMNDRTWHKERIHKALGAPDHVPGNGTAYTDADVKAMLAACRKPLHAALVAFFYSTGCRPAALTDPVLRVRDLTRHPGGFYSLPIYRESKEEYTVFLTPYAAYLLDQYLATRPGAAPDDQLFIGQRCGSMTPHAVNLIMEVLIKRAGVVRRSNGYRYDKAILYGFRKRFATKLKLEPTIDGDIVEKLLGHKNGLNGAYLKPTVEQLLAEFRKAPGVLDP